MKKHTRKFIFLVFFALFFIAAPVVVLYTAGYRLNFERFSLVKTGVFFLSTSPKNAKIVIDNKTTTKETPIVFDNIMPGEHLVHLEKSGYIPWEKKLEIKENETTFVQKAVLFLWEEPELKTSGIFSASALDVQGKNFAFAKEEESWIEVWSLSLTSEEKKLLLRLPKIEAINLQLNWFAEGSFLLVKETRGADKFWTVISNDGSLQINLADELLKLNNQEKIIDVTFDPFQNTGKIYLKTENETWSWTNSLSGSELKLLLNEPLSVWQRDSSQLLFVSPSETGVNLIRRNQNNLDQTLASLPVGKYEFLPAPPSFVFLHDVARNKIFLIDDRGVDQPILLNTEAFQIAWNPQNEKQFLYTSDFELHIYNAETRTDELLTRVSSPITNIAWHESGTNIFYTDNSNLYTLELDKRGDGRQIFILAFMDNISSFAPTNDEKTIFLTGQKAENTGIFKRRLKE